MKCRVDDSLAESLALAATSSDRVTVLFDYMQRRGQTHYDESVTQLEHALQCACLARNAQASNEEIIAALLHDIGHFLTDEDDAHGDFFAEDWCHETLGADCLSRFIAKPVIAAIRMHVLAKRFLCSTEPSYLAGLSRASERSFRLQGGEMSDLELAEFRAHPYYEIALRVRRWDDGGKVADWNVPLLETYRPELEACMLGQ
jgi:predicted HD phosphohydrolase